MIICIDLLSADQLAAIHENLAQATFRDGAETAGWYARDVKRNEQARGDDPAAREVRKLIERALDGNPLVGLAARPRRRSPLLLSRYTTGMTYGAHVDDAVMQGDAPLRADLAFTVFLSDPDSYAGGELVIDTITGEQEFRLPAGAMVLYPASTLHRVEPVERGVRLAAVGWMQSLVRDPAQRELLFELDTSRRTLYERHGRSHETDVLARSVSNLLRMWSEV